MFDAELRDRRDRGMAEGAVSLARDARQVGVGNAVTHERADHFDRDLGIGAAGERRDRLRAQPRPGVRHIEAAVTGEARERDVEKAERRSLAAGGNVTQ